MEEFVSELQSFGIKFLVDVRTSPYSKWAPQFNRGIIEKWLHEVGIKYGYMGDSIGGRPLNDSCYDDQGYFDYEKMANETQFKDGLLRLVKANTDSLPVAVMCSESDPSECHRSKLIGRELYFNFDLRMLHIVGIGKSVTQEAIMQSLSKGAWEPVGNLFGDCEPPYFKSRKAYKNITEAEETYQLNPYD